MKIDTLTALVMTIFYGLIIIGLYVVIRMAFLATGLDAGTLNTILSIMPTH